MSEQLSLDGFAPSEQERRDARRILNNGLADYLGVGPENAITTKRLAERLFTNERAVTLAVYDARRAGLPICSGQEGFFLPRHEHDVTICHAGLLSRAAEIQGSADAILAGWDAGWRPAKVEEG